MRANSVTQKDAQLDQKQTIKIVEKFKINLIHEGKFSNTKFALIKNLKKNLIDQGKFINTKKRPT